VGETRVDLLHLLEDLRDAYPGSTEETILTEIVANSLDSGATTIAIATDPTAILIPTPANPIPAPRALALTIVDDGDSMKRRETAPVTAKSAQPGQAPSEEPATATAMSFAPVPPAQPEPPPATGRLAGGLRTRRPARYGHPAYRRAVASRSEGYHLARAVALALAPLAVDPAKEHAFITAFLARWGAAIERRGGSRRR
jgi:hypothetical protein